MNDKEKNEKFEYLAKNVPYIMASFDSIFDHTNKKSPDFEKFAIISSTLIALELVGVITINSQK